MGIRALCVLALAGCYEPPVTACGIICTDTCPGDLVCTPEHVCRSMTGMCTTPPIDFAAIGVGSRHICGLDVHGSIWCWGDNSVGQLGIQGITQASAPTLVGDAKQVWTALAVGSEHTCGITDNGVMCWGQNAGGQVNGGAGGTFQVPSPPEFAAGAPAFDHVTAGGSQTCALANGALWCWGAAPQNGTGTTSVATQVGALTDWTAISAGYDHTCGISTSQGVMCWGNNGHHQTGDPGTTNITAPQQVALPGPVAQIVAGDLLTCAILTDGTLWCWGFNNGSQLIDANATDYAMPQQIAGGGVWTSASMQNRRMCGVRDGMALCWGTSNIGGLGDGLWSEFQIHADQAKPIAAADVVAVGFESPNGTVETGCMLAANRLSCWGENQHGELGLGFATRHKVPVPIPAQGSPWAHVYSGHRHTCASNTQGDLYCWGADYTGQVSAAVARGQNQPCVANAPCDYATPVPAPKPVAPFDELVAGYNYTCTRSGGGVHCWGDPIFGQTGVQGSIGYEVTTVNPTAGVWSAIYGGDRGTCGTTTAGGFECFGLLGGGQINMPTDYTDPEVHDLVTLAAADDATCALRTDQSRVCWGGNGNGQLGNDTNVTNQTPTVIATGITAVALRSQHGCEVNDAGNVKCWGTNNSNESGVASGTPILTPALVQTATDMLGGCTKVAVGPDYSCAICTDNVWCWGRSSRGATGNRTITQRHIADLVGLPAGTFVELALGDTRACALDSAGELFCWGDGPHGETGDGSHASPFPVPVAPP